MARIAVLGTVAVPVIQAGSIVGPLVTYGTTATATLSVKDIYIEFDTGKVPDTATLITALNNAFTFLKSTGSLTVS
jgi:hypothetical protein